MSPVLKAELFQKYPKIFADPSNPSLAPSCGIDCCDGWFRLIERLCHCVQALVDEQGEMQHVAEYVKEKFGGLRFYWTGSTDRVDAMTDLAESLSWFICEECGAPGTRNTAGWMSTLCVAHRRRP